MTRINTNVSSLIAQKTLSRSNSQLQEALTRLSTGLRINVGKDDPAGLIASEALGSDIVATQRAITNSQRANQLIATADSALGQVSSLLNDIRGLVSEAANTGALSKEQIEANQLQVDSSLEAIDRIAQITSFQGRRLLDGSLGFITKGADPTQVQGLQIDQANFGTQSEIGVAVNVVSQAKKASLNYGFGAVAQNVVLQVNGSNGSEAFNFAAGSSISEIAKAVNLVSDATGVVAKLQQDATKGSATISSFGKDNDIVLTANDAGFDPGNIRVKYTKGDASGTTVNFTDNNGQTPDTLNIALKTQDYVAATAGIDDGGAAVGTKAEYHLDIKGNNNDLLLTATKGGSDLANYTVTLVNGAAAGAPTVTIDTSAKTLVIDLKGSDRTATVVRDAINNDATVSKYFSAAYATIDVASGTNTGAGTAVATETANFANYQVTQGTGADENALDFTARIKGAQFNDVNVNFVDDAARVGSASAVSAGSEKAFYFQDARKAQAYVDLGTIGTADTDFIVTAAKAGKDYNNVKIVFTANNVQADKAAAAYDDQAKTLTIDVSNDGSTQLSTVLAAVNATDDFTAAKAGASTLTNTVSLADTRKYQGIRGDTGVSGGDAGTLYVHISNNKTTAAQLVAAISASGNERVAKLFEVKNRPDQSGTGVISAGQYVDAFAGGKNGGDVLATAQDVVNAINASGAVSTKLTASLAKNEVGASDVSAFDHFAYTGDAELNNRLQFLGGDNSRKIEFVASGNNTALGVDLATKPAELDAAKATFLATNANASLTFQAIKAGPEADNVSVLFEDRGSDTVNSVVFNPEPTKSTATLAFTGNNNDLKLTANKDGTLDFNNVTVNLVTQAGLGNKAEATYTVTPATKTTAETRVLTITVDSAGATGIDKVADAINAEGTFSAGLDKTVEQANDGSGVVNQVAGAIGTGTGNSGSINGTLTFRIQDGVTTASQVASLLANDDVANKYFIASNFGSSSGAGVIDVANDTASTNHVTLTSGGLKDAGTLVVNLATDANGLVTTTANDLINYFNDPANASKLQGLGISLSNAEGSDGTGVLAATKDPVEFKTSGTNVVDDYASATIAAVNGANARFILKAKQAGSEFDGVKLQYEEDPLLTGNGDETAAYDAQSKTLTVKVRAGITTVDSVISAIQNSSSAGDKFDASLIIGGNGNATVSLSDTGTTSGGTRNAGTVDGVALLGNSDAGETGLTFESATYGSDAFVQVSALSGNFALTNADGDSTDRSNGADVDLRINGVKAIGKGLKASLNTASLDLSFSLNDSIKDGTDFDFKIIGGGARFQLGPDVVSNQQARLGIQTISTATLGGANGSLFELRSGGAKNLSDNPNGAAQVVEDVITQVTQLRGRLGAFQRTTLETNIAALNDTLAAITDAQSSIRDADFAAESAKLTRAQILVQSGTTVLQIANQNPQNVLALLRG